MKAVLTVEPTPPNTPAMAATRGRGKQQLWGSRAARAGAHHGSGHHVHWEARWAYSKAENACLCSNGGNWITNSVTCIAAIDPNDMSNTLLGDVWDVMATNCESTDTPVAFT